MRAFVRGWRKEIWEEHCGAAADSTMVARVP